MSSDFRKADGRIPDLPSLFAVRDAAVVSASACPLCPSAQAAPALALEASAAHGP